MRCPHCSVTVHFNWQRTQILCGAYTNWDTDAGYCPACDKLVIALNDSKGKGTIVHPQGTGREPTPAEVPPDIAQDYEEASLVLPYSPKASAALSRRCLQNLLDDKGYRGKDLAKQIDNLLDEPDPKKAISSSLRTTVDAIRNFGNFSAHPITDVTTQKIIDVEPHEAEFCLELLEEAFHHFYVQPAQAAARKAALDEKLSKAGKPTSKS